MPKVTFRALGKSVDIPEGATVFDAGAQVHAMIETACVGKGTCGLCRVKVLEGEAFLPAYTDEELKHLGNVYHITKVRLSCRLQVRGGDVVVDLAPRKTRPRPGPR